MSKTQADTALTDQQIRFCQEYIIDLNGKQAAIRAAYSEATAKEQASRLLTNVNVQDFIQKLMDVRSKETEITALYVLNKIRETIEKCSQAEKVMEFDYDLKQMVSTGEWKFEHNGVLKGCELLGRHLKLFTDKIEHSGKVTWEQMLAGSYKKKEDETT